MAAASLTDRVGALEAHVAVIASLPAHLSRLETEVVEFRAEVRQEFALLRQALRVEIREGDDQTECQLREEIREGDEETRRLMRVLHEDLIERLNTIGEGLNGGPSRPKRVRR